MAAYLVSMCKVTNPHDNFKKYIKLSEDMMKSHGGRYIVRGPAVSIYEGDYLTGLAAIIAEFPTMEMLKGFVESEDYKKNVAPLRAGSGVYDIGAYPQSQ